MDFILTIHNQLFIHLYKFSFRKNLTIWKGGSFARGWERLTRRLWHATLICEANQLLRPLIYFNKNIPSLCSLWSSIFIYGGYYHSLFWFQAQIYHLIDSCYDCHKIILLYIIEILGLYIYMILYHLIHAHETIFLKFTHKK